MATYGPEGTRVRAEWLWQREPGVTQAVVGAVLSPLGWLYGGMAGFHRGLYRTGWLRARRLGLGVVSIGNLVVGGTGKTPLAAWVAAGLRDRGHRVVLASRGYGRRDRAALRVVSDGRRIAESLATAGDEPMLLAAQLPGVPVMVGRDRALLGLRAQTAFDADVLVLDDGFQHHRLQRDVEIVSFDGVSGFGNSRCLPLGPLREFPHALSVAHAVAVVDGPLREAEEEALRKRSPDALRIQAWRRPESLRTLDGGERQEPASLRGRAVGLLAGIARPSGFRRTLEALGAEVVAERHFPDHHRYRASDLSGLSNDALTWVTTEKDAAKILPRFAAGVDLRVLCIRVAVDAETRVLDWLESCLAQRDSR